MHWIKTILMSSRSGDSEQPSLVARTSAAQRKIFADLLAQLDEEDHREQKEAWIAMGVGATVGAATGAAAGVLAGAISGTSFSPAVALATAIVAGLTVGIAHSRRSTNRLKSIRRDMQLRQADSLLALTKGPETA